MSVEKFQQLGREDYRVWRAEQAAARRILPNPREIVRTETVIEYRDRIVDGLQNVQDKLKAVTPKPQFEGQRFRTSFLLKEGEEGADLAALDAALFLEYETLEMSRPLPPDKEPRRKELHENMFDFRG